jgi:predicted glycosyltransferase
MLRHCFFPHIHPEFHMNRVHLLSLAVTFSFLGMSAWAAPKDEHTGHHPAGSAPTTTSKQAPAKKAPSMAKMDAQTYAMRDMHEKMMATKTPEERSALMAEHMKTMQDGMSMMNEMPAGGMKSMKGDMSLHHQMMEKRMEMMGASMQMMMDRLPQAPAK